MAGTFTTEFRRSDNTVRSRAHHSDEGRGATGVIGVECEKDESNPRGVTLKVLLFLQSRPRQNFSPDLVNRDRP